MDKTEIYNILIDKIPKEKIMQDEPMSKHTSFRIGGNADFLIKADTEDDVRKTLQISQEINIPLTVLGNGSNVLVKDSGIKGIVLKICIDNIDMENNENDQVLVTVGAGVLLGKLAQILLQNSISGFEFASGIPGTIGGAVRMNAGAYGSEFKDIVIETTCMNQKGEILKLSNEDQEFAYRSSIFQKEKYIVLKTTFLLKKVEDAQVIKDKMVEYRNSRLEKQPMEYPSAGSTFKRGEDFITAQLIDECGLKGFTVGGAQVSTKHAGFVVNVNNATAEDVLKLIDVIKEKVFEKFNKKIELEIEILG